MWSWYQKWSQTRKPEWVEDNQNRKPEWVENNTQKCTSNRLSFTLEQVDSSQSCRDYCILNAPYRDVTSYWDGTRTIKLDVVHTQYYKDSRICDCFGPEKKTPEENVGIYCETRSDAPQNYIKTTRTTIIPEKIMLPKRRFWTAGRTFCRPFRMRFRSTFQRFLAQIQYKYITQTRENCIESAV